MSWSFDLSYLETASLSSFSPLSDPDLEPPGDYRCSSLVGTLRVELADVAAIAGSVKSPNAPRVSSRRLELVQRRSSLSASEYPVGSVWKGLAGARPNQKCRMRRSLKTHYQLLEGYLPASALSGRLHCGWCVLRFFICVCCFQETHFE